MINQSSQLLAVALLATLTAMPASAKQHTNVIIIYADDLGYGDLSCYGHEKFKTPRLDRLAAEGARLTRFNSSCPYCAPSRVSLQTGRYQVRSGLMLNPCPGTKNDEIGMPQSEITLGEVFKSAGYATCCIGKWHLGHKPQFHPLRNGYDEYLGILYSNDMHPVELWDGDKVVEYPVFQPTITRRYTDRAIDFVERNKSKPFFLYLPHAMPHKPLAASEEFYKKSGAGLYGDVLAELDANIGRLIDKLKELKIEKHTLVFFTSDNGPWYGGSTGGLRGMKGRTWEGGLRVPLIAWQPGRIPAGHVSDESAIIMDVFTTALTAAGIKVPDDRIIDGKDIMPLLTSDAKSPHDALFSFRGPNLCTAQQGKWKLHVRRPDNPRMDRVWRPDEEWIDPRRPDGVTLIAQFEQAHPSQFPGLLTGDTVERIGLFDLESDPGEQHNIADKHPEIVRKLQQLMKDRFPQE
jgi:uncharacterized sulfatase